jgi:hypothetical protein
MIRCKLKGYTPLDKVAASRTENEFILESDAKVAELLIRACSVKELYVNSRNNLERLAPLSLHVKAMSILQFKLDSNATNTITQSMTTNAQADKKQHLHRASKIVLGAIAPHCSLETLSEALETLYSCNSLVIMDMIQQEAKQKGRHNNNTQFGFGKQARDRSAKGHWIWEWLLDILAILHTRTAPNQNAPFHALHLLSSISNCPPPFLLLAMQAYPYDIRTPNPSTGNLPLHYVSAWKSDVSNVRKYMCLQSLSVAHDQGLAVPNNLGKTPVQLDGDAGTNLLDMGVSGHDLRRLDNVEDSDSSHDGQDESHASDIHGDYDEGVCDDEDSQDDDTGLGEIDNYDDLGEVG